MIALSQVGKIYTQSEKTLVPAVRELFEDIHARSGITIVLVTRAGQLVSRATRAVHMAGGATASDYSVREPTAAQPIA